MHMSSRSPVLEVFLAQDVMNTQLIAEALKQRPGQQFGENVFTIKAALVKTNCICPNFTRSLL
jgi:hypothetical protein